MDVPIPREREAAMFLPGAVPKQATETSLPHSLTCHFSTFEQTGQESLVVTAYFVPRLSSTDQNGLNTNCLWHY